MKLKTVTVCDTSPHRSRISGQCQKYCGESKARRHTSHTCVLRVSCARRRSSRRRLAFSEAALASRLRSTDSTSGSRRHSPPSKLPPRKGTTFSPRTLEIGGRTFDPALRIFDIIKSGRHMVDSRLGVWLRTACFIVIRKACFELRFLLEPRKRKAGPSTRHCTPALSQKAVSDSREGVLGLEKGRSTLYRKACLIRERFA